ncbi:hypothetical protein IP81_18750 [Novosphingobium sp. AAP83]|uniref:hypothetical protein n=1 Tax=Novosphingobium sp. AAP83 TaxID=1523425 RepID=UPI0006B8FDC2|nr:hypothetical protein [Novosphingobium sp. AAP83]KPF87775.1 hypothetical protein IP81_18750 [Novosphingobium sp. AAP83]
MVHELADGRRFYYFDTIPEVEGAGGRSSLTEGASQPNPIEVTPNEINLVRLTGAGKPAVATDTSVNAEALQKRLESYGIARKVALRIVDTLNGAAGEYQGALMKIAIDTTQAETFTLDHEVI